MRKVFYDSATRNVIIENVSRYFSSGSLLATNVGDYVAIKYLTTDKLEVYDLFGNFLKENGTSAGANVTQVVDYLNGEFNKGLIDQASSFTGLSTTKTITDARIKAGDTILLQGIGTLNETLGYTASNGSFTVTRTVISVVIGLTNNLAFKWVRI